MTFSNKNVVVTGGATGIGFACVETFLKENANVFCVDIDEKKAQESLSELKTDKISFHNVDISDQRAVNNFFSNIHGVDILVNNAGTIHTADFLEIEAEHFDRVLNVNLRGSFLMGQAAAKNMVAHKKKGSIINMSSVNGVMAIGNQVPYVVSKGGLNQLTKVMALSLVKHGIRVNGVGPGSIMTDLLKVVMNDDAAKSRILSRTPMGRCGEPSEIAEIVKFLASDSASYITGQTIYADGGRLALNYTV